MERKFGGSDVRYEANPEELLCYLIRSIFFVEEERGVLRV